MRYSISGRGRSAQSNHGVMEEINGSTKRSPRVPEMMIDLPLPDGIHGIVRLKEIRHAVDIQVIDSVH